jgi:hypothetical protein
MQLVQYVKVFRSYMGKHRDNTTQLDVKGMTEGKEIDFKKILCGIPSSQVPGSNVIVYTTGNRPMEMKFSYPASQDKVLCERKYFVTNIRYQLQCRNGWATILDPIDDITMCHEVAFENDDDNDIEGYRLAWIVRWVNGKQDYFVDTSGLRRTARMMEVYGDDIRVDDAYPDRVRDILS